MPAKLNLLGQKYGRLTVIAPAPRQNNNTAWLCQCDCGNQKIVITRSLRTGNTQSCGCLHKEVVAKNFSKDITNQRFGNLIALEPTQERRHGSIVWKCLCDCGNFHFTTTELLLGGHTQSCGCIRSRGNQKVQQILQQNNIPFIKEYPIRINNMNYYYDFAIVQNEKVICFIEYDGILHFEQDKYHGWNNAENWKRTQENDNIKNDYAKNNNIPIVRIPYLDYEILDINYIIAEMEKNLCTVDILLK